MSRFPNLKHLLSKQSYYKRMFFFYSIFTIIMVIASSFILISYSNSNLEKETNKSNQRLLTQIKILSDSYMLDKLNSIVNEKFVNISRDEDIRDFFSYNYTDSNFLKYKALTSIKGIALNFDYIDSIYFYRKADDLLISSKEGIIYSALAPDNAYKDYINTHIINSFILSDRSQYWYSPLENASFSKDKPTISVAISIPMFASKEERTGCVIINIDQESFFKSIKKISDTDSGDIMIVSSNGEVFAHSDKAKLYEPITQTNEIKQIMKNDDGFIVSNVNYRRTGISWMKSSVNDWKYISLVPIEELNKNILIARQFMLIIVGFVIFFSIMGMNFITTFLYKPFKEIIRTSKEKYNIKNVSNEFTVINSVISNLSLKVEGMEATIEENKGIIQYKLAMDVLYGNIKDEGEFESRLKIADKEFPFDCFAVIMIEINPKLFNQLSPEQKEFISLKAIDIIDHMLNIRYRSISVCIPSNCIVTIINVSDMPQELYSDLENLMEIMKKELSLSYNLSISKITTALSSINNIYLSASNCLKYSFIYGFGNIFKSETIDKYEISAGDIALDILKQYETLLKLGKYDQLKQEIEKSAINIKTEGYSYNYTQTVIVQIAGLVSKIIRDQGISYDKSKTNEINADFNNITTLDEGVNWIFKLIDIYKESIAERNHLIDHDFMEKIIGYIAANIDKQISLNMIADEFNISTGHLSRLFKEGTGTNFSDYIIEIKFKRAAELLLQSRLEVSQIAEKLGYLNLSYFSKLFKEKYGVTPVQYRKMNK